MISDSSRLFARRDEDESWVRWRGQDGNRIEKSLLRAGHHLRVYNRTRSRSEALLAGGAAVAGYVAEACCGEVVMTMLSDDAAVEAVTFGEGGILASLKRGSAHVSLSTIGVAMSERLARNTSGPANSMLRHPCSEDPRQRRGKFAAALGLKDIRLVLAAADSLNVPMPIASVLRDRSLTAIARGNAESDWSVLGRIAEEDAGLTYHR